MLFENQKAMIDECASTLESISDIINANLESLSSTSNYNLQKTTLITNVFSAIFALIAIIISLSITDPLKGIWIKADSLLNKYFRSIFLVAKIGLIMLIGFFIIRSIIDSTNIIG